MTPPDTPAAPRLITLVIAAAVSALAMNLFLPSLPGMARAFDVEYAVMQLTVSVYLFATAFVQLLIGPMSDRFGRRPVMIVCFSVFILATLGILAAPNFEVLLIMRAFQAFSAAGVVLSRAIVRDLVEPARAASMIGYITMGMALAPMIAPAIGGVLEERHGWQATFLLLLGCGIVALLFVVIDLSETHHVRSSSIMAQVRSYPELLTSRRYWGYVLAASFTAGQFFAFIGGGPFVATEIMRLTPTTYGLLFGLTSFGYLLGNFLTGRYSERMGISRMIFLGNGCAIAGGVIAILLLAIFPREPLAFFGPAVLTGLGNGIALPNAMAGMVSVRKHLAGAASGLGSAVQIGVGGLFSVLGGAFLAKGSTAFPLVLVMLGSALLALAAAFYTMLVERRRRTT